MSSVVFYLEVEVELGPDAQRDENLLALVVAGEQLLELLQCDVKKVTRA